MASSDEKSMEAAAAAGQTGSQSVVVGFLEYRDVPPVSFSFEI